jgi:hypothetical protein
MYNCRTMADPYVDEQRWVPRVDGTVTSIAAKKCLNTNGGRSEDGTGLVIRPCSTGTTDLWAPGGASLTNVRVNKCVDIRGGGISPANNTVVQLYSCKAAVPGQQWVVFRDGTLRAAGKCLDVSGGSLKEGAQLVVYDCNGSLSQEFTEVPHGFLYRTFVHTETDLCVGRQDNGSADQTPLVLAGCDGSDGQSWLIDRRGWA